MRLLFKLVAIAMVMVFFSSFTAISLYNEPSTIGISPYNLTPYNVLPSYVYNNSSYNYKVGYLNFSGYGNGVSYVYVVLPLEGYKVVNRNYTGPFLDFSIFKVSQKTGFPFSNTSLSASIQMNPDAYITSPMSHLVPHAFPYSLSSLVQGSFANRPVGTGNMTFWINITVTPVFEIGPYHISGGTKTLPFQFKVDVSNATKS